MKKLFSKSFSFVISIVMLISIISTMGITAFASENECYEYHIEEDGVYISATTITDTSLTGLTIPASIDDMPVVGIDDNAFFDTDLEWLSIPESVTVLGNNIVDTTKCVIRYNGSREQWVNIANSAVYNKFVSCADGVIYPAVPTISKIATSYLDMTVSFKLVQADGYQIQYSVYSDFRAYKTINIGNSSCSKRIASLSAKKYYVRMRAYYKINGKNYYSAWSGAKSVTVKGETLTLSATSATTYPKKTYTIKATTNPSGKKVTWTSSNKKVATVDKNGKVTGVKTGTATITCKYVYNKKTIKKTCKITVKNPCISKTSVTVYNSKTTKLAVNGALSKVTWSSSNKKVATVNSSGVVTGIKAGKCTITAKCGGKTYKCTVTVSNRVSEMHACIDFGAVTGIKRAKTVGNNDKTAYIAYYKAADVDKLSDNAVSNYVNAVMKAGFEYYGTYTDDYGYECVLFANDKYGIELSGDNSYLYVMYFKF